MSRVTAEFSQIAHDAALAASLHPGCRRATGAACVSIALAIIVRLAQRLPAGADGRRALAEASVPLRDYLDEQRV